MPRRGRATPAPTTTSEVRGALIAGTVAAVLGAFWLGTTPAFTQARTYRAPRTADGKPNLNGTWQALNTANWFDRAGNFHSDALHVVERYTATGPDHLLYEATIEDPKVFTRPWKMSMPLYRRMEKNAMPLEYICVEFAEELMYGHLKKPNTR
jgi:hypothetical protein